MHIAIVAPANPSEFVADLVTTQEFPKGMGGVPVNVLIRSLLDLGHQVSLFTASTGLEDVWRAEGPRLKVVVVPYRSRARDRALDFFRKERFALSAEISECRADVFHAHWTYEFALAAIRAGANPLVVTAHDAPLTVLRYLPDAYRFIRLLMAIRVRFSIRNLTAVSPYLAKKWRSQMGFLSPIFVIPNPVPPMEIRTKNSKRPIVILDVANGSALKNLKTLLRAFPAILLEYPTATLRLVGEGLGPDNKLAVWSKNKMLADGVLFIGPVSRSQLAAEFSVATVFCHPSLEESQGVCLLEAMNAKVPVVAGSKSGAVPWTLFDGEGGLLVDVTSTKSISDAILSISNSPQASDDFVERAATLTEQRYGPFEIASQYLACYEVAIMKSVQ
jgi:glycosyltransferase involved in cell wall biosynthesis